MNVEQQLPYEPIAFVHTQTIGSQSHHSENSPIYLWSYQDILRPHITYPHFYYIFHIPPIYNWLRNNLPECFQKEQLKKYLKKQSIPQNINTQVLENLIKLSGRWQIIKLCLKAQIKVLSTFKQCPHLLKKWSQYYIYDHKEKKIVSKQFYCQHCDRKMEGKISIVQYPFAPFFHKYHGDIFQNSQEKNNKNEPIKYILTIVFENQSIYVKAANGIWYQMNKATKKVSMKSFEGKKNKEGLFIYVKQTAFDSKIILKEATVLKETKLKKQKQEQVKNQISIPKREKFPKKSHFIQAQNNHEELRSLDKSMNQIVVGKEKIHKHYAANIEKLYPKPKQKDEYEKQYDQGKTKKIKKKAQYYYKPDFNSVYKELQKNEGISEEQPEINRNFRGRRKWRKERRQKLSKKFEEE